MIFSKSIQAFLLLFMLASFQSDLDFKKLKFKNSYKLSSEIEEKTSKATEAWKYQISAADYASKGDYKNALSQWDLAFPVRERSYTQSEVDSLRKLYKTTNAKGYIIEQAKEKQIVIINEAHHNSLHRMFTKSLLQELYDNGYRNLGLEALANEKKRVAQSLNSIKHPVQSSGYYTTDPQFGDLIRTALKIGYYVFPYEQTGNKNGKDREIAQAQNIKAMIEQKPNEKFLIHCGFDHALEGKHRSWEKAMAERLKEFTGIDPLTINQVEFSEKGNTKLNHPLQKAMSIEVSSVLLNSDNEPYRYERKESWSDIAVFHPNTDYIQNRPNWLFNNENQKVEIDLEKIDIEFPVMVMAFKDGEDISVAIPLDITEIVDKNRACLLALKTGKYKLVITNQNNEARVATLAVN